MLESMPIRTSPAGSRAGTRAETARTARQHAAGANRGPRMGLGLSGFGALRVGARPAGGGGRGAAGVVPVGAVLLLVAVLLLAVGRRQHLAGAGDDAGVE